MDRESFEAACIAEGFSALEQRDGTPGFTSDLHTHPFDVRGMMVDGEFSLTRNGETRTYTQGETFAMEAGCEHAESFGEGGAVYLVARRQPGGASD